jgi:hypothetical protein
MNSKISKLKEIENHMQVHKVIQEKENHIKELKCHFCGYWIDDSLDEHYYFCEIHKNVFCDKCAKNNYQREINFREAPKCKGKFMSVNKKDYFGENINPNCIYLKRFLKLQEI